MPVNKKVSWTDLHQNKFIWLYNWYKKNHDSEANIKTFIEENKRQLMGLIQKDPNWSTGSKEGLLFMVSRYLYNIKNNDRYVKLYSQAAYDLLQAHPGINAKIKIGLLCC
jgi:hypothetical protein